MFTILNYLIENFDEVSYEEIIEFINSCSKDDCTDFANLLVLFDNISDEISNAVFAKIN